MSCLSCNESDLVGENDVVSNPVIKVIAVGGGGGNMVRRMVDAQMGNLEYIILNTDSQALKSFEGDAYTLQIGRDNNGQGAGGDPMKGRRAATESRDEIRELISGADLLFVTAGLGGGTGTGAAPVIAELAR